MKKMLLVGATVAALTVVTAAVVLAFSVSGSGNNPTATTNCTPAITVAVGSAANPLVPGTPQNVPVTVTDIDDCYGVGVTITSATPTLTGTVPCPKTNYIVSPITLSDITTSGGSVVLPLPIELWSGAKDSCQGEPLGISVAVSGTVP